MQQPAPDGNFGATRVPVQLVWLPPSEGCDGTDEEMVTDEEIGDGFSPT